MPPNFRTTVVPTQPARYWQKKKKTSEWLFKAAARGSGWRIDPQIDGTEMTEAEYDRAIAAVANLRLG